MDIFFCVLLSAFLLCLAEYYMKSMYRLGENVDGKGAKMTIRQIFVSLRVSWRAFISHSALCGPEFHQAAAFSAFVAVRPLQGNPYKTLLFIDRPATTSPYF